MGFRRLGFLGSRGLCLQILCVEAAKVEGLGLRVGMFPLLITAQGFLHPLTFYPVRTVIVPPNLIPFKDWLSGGNIPSCGFKAC